MARGFLTGTIWGTVVAGMGVAGLSLVMDPPAAGPSDVAPYPAPPAVGEQNVVDAPEAGDPADPGRRPAPEDGVDAPAMPVAVPDAPADPVAIGADTTPLKAPEIGDAPDAPVAAERAPEAADIAVASEAPVLPAAPAAAPEAPAPEGGLDISTSPAQPPLPAADTAALVDEEKDSAAVDVADDPAVVDDAVVDADVVDDGAVVQAEDAEPKDSIGEDRVAEALAALVPRDPVDLPDAGTEVAPVVEAAPSAPVVDPLPDADPADVPPAPEDVAPEVAAAAPAIGKPATSLLSRDGAVPEGRLPRVGAVEAAADQVAPALDDAGPVAQFAAQVEVAADVPRMAIVLVDQGDSVMGPEAFEAFPFPISFAIPTSHPDPAAAAQAYRSQGFEVLAMGSLPPGAQPSDVEVTLTSVLDLVPEALAVIEDPEGGFQETKEVAAQATSVLAETGHGLVMLPKGLNTAQKLALKAGVPSAVLFRDLDGEGQGSDVIRRTLDQAAFRARQEGAVVMLGRLQPDSVSALLLWGLQDRSGAIALTPISTVLRESLED